MTPKLKEEECGNKGRRRGRKERACRQREGHVKAQNPEHDTVRELQGFLERGISGLVSGWVSYPSGKEIQKKEWSLSAEEQARLLRRRRHLT